MQKCKLNIGKKNMIASKPDIQVLVTGKLLNHPGLLYAGFADRRFKFMGKYYFLKHDPIVLKPKPVWRKLDIKSVDNSTVHTNRKQYNKDIKSK